MPTQDELDVYYQTEYRAGTSEVRSSPYEDPSDVNYRTLSQMEYIRALDIKPHSIVDVGCGFGLLLDCLGKVFPRARLFGIEVSEKCHPALSRLQIEHAHTILERENRNPFKEQFDLLVCSHVLEHSGDIARFLSVCHTMLRPGGTAVIEVPNCEYEYGLDIPHVIFFTPKTLKQALERNGFTVLKCQTCGPTIERWLPGRSQRLRHWAHDHLPPDLVRILEFMWRIARSVSPRQNAVSVKTTAGLRKLEEEAKDQAWFRYDQAGFKHSAIRCVAVRDS